MSNSLEKVPYSVKEERLNTLTHAFGAALSLVGLIIFMVTSLQQQDISKFITHTIYGLVCAVCLVHRLFTMVQHRLVLKSFLNYLTTVPFIY